MLVHSDGGESSQNLAWCNYLSYQNYNDLISILTIFLIKLSSDMYESAINDGKLFSPPLKFPVGFLEFSNSKETD